MPGPKPHLPIPSNLVADWDEPEIDIHKAKRTDIKYKWKCRFGRNGSPGCGRTFRNYLSHRLTYKTGCPWCARDARKRPLVETLRREWAEEFPIESAPYLTSHKWRCEKGHGWTASIFSRLNTRDGGKREAAGCPRCAVGRSRRNFRAYPVPDYLRADWDEETPIEEASRKKRWRFVHRGSQRGEVPCGRSWSALLFARIGKMKTGCPHCFGGVKKPGNDSSCTDNDGLR